MYVEIAFRRTRRMKHDGRQWTKKISTSIYMGTQTGRGIASKRRSVYLENQQESIIAGAHAFLPKPIDANTLSELLSALQVVEWRYKEENPHSKTDYSAIPKEWLDKLQQMSVIADVEKIQEAIHDIRTIAPAFADDLEKLAYHFEYDKIMRLLQNIQS